MLLREHIANFQCMGAECPDHCCGEWGVKVSNSDQERLDEVLQQAEKQALLEPYSGGKKIRQENGRCSAQCDQGWCTIQQRFGHGYLPDICASYPRSYKVVNERHELSGFLSCPQIVRLSLFHETAMQWITDSSQPRAVLEHEIADQQGAYFKKFLQIREDVSAMILHPDHDLAHKIEQVGAFVQLSPAFFNRSSHTDDSAKLYARLANHQFAQNAPTNQQQINVWKAVFLAVQQFLTAPTPYKKPDQLIRDAILHWGQNPEVAAQRFLDKEAHFWEINRLVLEPIWLRYMLHDWNVRWYTLSADLVMHWERTMFKWALIRIILLSNVDGWKESLVAAVYSVERLVEHTAWQKYFSRHFWPLKMPVQLLFCAFTPKEIE